MAARYVVNHMNRGEVSDIFIKLFLEYADLSEETPILLERITSSGSAPDPHQYSLLASQATSLPRILQLLPSLFPKQEDVQQIAGLSDMLSELHKLARALHLSGYVSFFSLNLVGVV